MPAGASSERARGTVRPATSGSGDRLCKRQVQLRPVIREPTRHTLLVLVTMQTWPSWAMPTGNSPVWWRRLPRVGLCHDWHMSAFACASWLQEHRHIRSIVATGVDILQLRHDTEHGVRRELQQHGQQLPWQTTAAVPRSDAPPVVKMNSAHGTVVWLFNALNWSTGCGQLRGPTSMRYGLQATAAALGHPNCGRRCASGRSAMSATHLGPPQSRLQVGWHVSPGFMYHCHCATGTNGSDTVHSVAGGSAAHHVIPYFM
jgi:hypothetical protein